MLLAVDNLAVTRGGREVLAAVSFTVAAGEALVLTGPNGAGKTTLIRTIAGLIRPDAGSVRLVGGDAEASVGEQAHHIGHLNAVRASLTVAENIAFWGDFLADGAPRVSSQRPEQGPASALARLGLAPLADIPAGYLSAGQKRRLCLARLLVAHRPLWLLDEPTVSLDTNSLAVLAGLIGAHLAGGGLVVAATHVPLGITTARELRLGQRSSDGTAGVTAA